MTLRIGCPSNSVSISQLFPTITPTHCSINTFIQALPQPTCQQYAGQYKVTSTFSKTTGARHRTCELKPNTDKTAHTPTFVPHIWSCNMHIEGWTGPAFPVLVLLCILCKERIITSNYGPFLSLSHTHTTTSFVTNR
jgi:hypothetical protein